MPTTSLEPRKMPQQARARATHVAILQSATQLLSASELDDFNTNAIAERAGTSIGTFYQYFPNKEAVLLTLIREQKAEMFTNIGNAMRDASGCSLEGAVRLLIRGRLKHLRDNQHVAWILGQQELLLPIPEVKAEYLEEGIQLFSRGLDHWGPAVEGIDAHRAAKTIPAMVRGIMESWIREPSHYLDIAEEEAVDSVLGYLHRQRRSASRSIEGMS